MYATQLSVTRKKRPPNSERCTHAAGDAAPHDTTKRVHIRGALRGAPSRARCSQARRRAHRGHADSEEQVLGAHASARHCAHTDASRRAAHTWHAPPQGVPSAAQQRWRARRWRARRWRARRWHARRWPAEGRRGRGSRSRIEPRVIVPRIVPRSKATWERAPRRSARQLGDELVCDRKDKKEHTQRTSERADAAQHEEAQGDRGAGSAVTWATAQGKRALRAPDLLRRVVAPTS